MQACQSVLLAPVEGFTQRRFSTQCFCCAGLTVDSLLGPVLVSLWVMLDKGWACRCSDGAVKGGVNLELSNSQSWKLYRDMKVKKRTFLKLFEG
jgi:hypothetical protein